MSITDKVYDALCAWPNATAEDLGKVLGKGAKPVRSCLYTLEGRDKAFSTPCDDNPTHAKWTADKHRLGIHFFHKHWRGGV